MNVKESTATAVAARQPDGARWFFQRRLGLFVHWGLYAVDAWQEQDLWRRKRQRDEYARLAARFHPRHFNPDAWLDTAEAAGMTYLCFTTKHCDGFCLWDTAETEFKVTRTPYGRDVLAELAAACQRRGMPLCLYYSIADLHHPAYPHAGRRWEYPESPPEDQPDQAVYLNYLRRQVEELCTRYGPIHGFWWDANPAHWQDPGINARIRELQPGIVINDRGFDAGDFGTPERDWDQQVDAQLVFEKPIEACQALGSQSWGYRVGEDYYTDKHLLRAMAKIRAKGGNYLLNTGPDADGRIAPEDQRMLGVVGAWNQRCSEAFDGTTPCSDLTANRDVVLTRRGNTLYVILHREPTTRSVPLRPLDMPPRSAVLLNSGQPVACQVELLPWDHREGRASLRIHHLPLEILDRTVPVIRLEFEADPVRSPATAQTIER